MQQNVRPQAVLQNSRRLQSFFECKGYFSAGAELNLFYGMGESAAIPSHRGTGIQKPLSKSRYPKAAGLSLQTQSGDRSR
jgi:hypothetical protein